MVRQYIGPKSEQVLFLGILFFNCRCSRYIAMVVQFALKHSLATLMQNLGLFAEEEYVELMRSKMDSEGLGIILVHQVRLLKSTEYFL